MDITGLENSIIAKLKAEINDYAIESYPDRPESYRLMHPKGAVLIHYKQSRFTVPKEPQAIVQIQTMDFDIIMLCRSLRGNTGCYEIMKRVKDAISGFVYQECDPFFPVIEELINYSDGIWEYGITYRTKFKYTSKDLEY